METLACLECDATTFESVGALANHQRTQHEQQHELQYKRARP
jgi:hypothetical protein